MEDLKMEFEYVYLIELGKGKYKVADKQIINTTKSPFTDDYNEFLEGEVSDMLDDTEMILYKMGIYKIIVGHPLDMLCPLFISLQQQDGEQLKINIINKKWYKKIKGTL